MRTMIAAVLILILWGAAPLLAQLPPEIQADLYLLRAEQAIGESDPARALVELDKILLLEKEHELDLPDEFHFRYAQAADWAGMPEEALDAVVKYLTGAGREGQHYADALELMNKVQDAIEGRKESQEASNEPISSAQASSQQSVEAESEAADRKEAHKEQEGLAGSGGTSEGQPESECNLWMWRTETFFQTATVQDVKACLDAGADPNARAEDKDTPLHWAAWSNENPMVIQALLAAGADPKAKGSGGDIPLRTAKRANNINAIKVLEGTGGPPIVSTQDCRMWRTDTFFQTATIQNVKACLEEGADPKLRGISDKTPLHRAARYNEEPEVIQALLQAGADPMARMTSRETPLHVAVQYNRNPAVIEALLKAGADPTARARKETPLHRAAEYNEEPGVIQALLAAGADPMARAGRKNTPLHLAAGDNENPAVIEALLKAGADPMAENKGGVTPLSWAKYRGYPAVIKALADGAGGARSVLKWTPLHEAAAINENPAAIEALLQAGADPMARDVDKRTPLHLAVRYNGTPAVIEALLAAGADLMARDGGNNTPLHEAAKYNENPVVTETLLKAGANPNARDGSNATPLHSAAWSNENPAVTEALLRAGADLAALNNRGVTPLGLVEEYPSIHAAVIQVLLAAGAGQVERQLAAERARRKAQSGPGFLEAAIGIAGGTAIAAAGGGSEEALEAGAVFAGGVIGAASPRGSTAGVPVAASSGNVGAGASGGRCEVPGYPRPPGGVANLGLAWCPASVSMQVRAFALQAAGAQCAIATGSSTTPEQIQARRREISAACGRLAALGASNCQCPQGLGGTGSSNYSSSIDLENERREQLARQQEEARQAAEREMQARQQEAIQAAQREKLRIESNNAEVLNSNCSCIGIDDRTGKYSCLDGFVVGPNSSGKPMCDIKR